MAAASATTRPSTPCESDWEQLAPRRARRARPGSRARQDFAPGSGHRKSWDDLILHADLREAIERLNPRAAARTAVHEALADCHRPRPRRRRTTENRTAHELPDRPASAPHLHRRVRRRAQPRPSASSTCTTRTRTTTSPSTRSRSIDGDGERRFDVVLYVNGLPLAVVELKSAGDENATLTGRARSAPDVRRGVPDRLPLQRALPGLRRHHRQVRHALHAVRALRAVERRRRRRARSTPATPDDDGPRGAEPGPARPVHPASGSSPCIRNFVNFDAGRTALASGSRSRTSTSRSPRPSDARRRPSQSNGKAGVVWHTQGSGKSEEMVLHAARWSPATRR